mmetsp:Transcript_13539/g.20622  ORF Transcript_13539/g.20622 Transcript_13539/m.20622 type:complete len:324 (-) Transcript_13539:168-1139(-)|eukprot:CAMPEP_0196811520 /NCGR_PEP_ID=MMETSP1362-20130617/18203_1 /TAXON_ID=163516 /ORGANISM="Leptocylindrus danicus, Strain CCMP1856" /LENGTH=323 /DNA_ID=CAMNT_0042186831 /DNA_START=37 /DNA_END=1008 /DNA_ORIENTATION=+
MKLYPLLLAFTPQITSAWRVARIFNKDFHQNEEILHMQLDRARKIAQKQCVNDVTRFCSAGKNYVKATNGIMYGIEFGEEEGHHHRRRLHHGNRDHAEHRLNHNNGHWHEHGHDGHDHDGHDHWHDHKHEMKQHDSSLRFPSLGFGGKSDACLRMHHDDKEGPLLSPKCSKAITGVDAHHERLVKQIEGDDQQENIYRYATMAIVVLSMMASWMVALLVNSDDGAGRASTMERLCLGFNKLLAAALVFVILFYCPALLLVIAPSFAVVQAGYYLFFHRPAGYPGGRSTEQYETVAMYDNHKDGNDDEGEHDGNLVFMGVPVDV